MTLYALDGLVPKLGRGVYVAPSADVMGDVVLGDEASVWFGAVVRGDVFPIRIGNRSNVQDNSVVHVTAGISATTIGDDVTIGHACNLHGCTIQNRVLVGLGSIILDDAVVEDDVLLGAGSLVAPRQRLVSGYLYFGRPAKKVRPLTPEERAYFLLSAEHYVAYSQRFARGLAKV